MSGRARILVVDDELGVREGCRKILAAEGYEVMTAGDGAAGLEQLVERGPFAVLLVDLQMPRMSGLELMRVARLRDPVILPIIITAHATLDTAVEGTRQGAYSYIPKPFTPDELLLSIKNGLERRTLALEARHLREEREKRLLELASERSRSTTIIAAMTADFQPMPPWWSWSAAITTPIREVFQLTRNVPSIAFSFLVSGRPSVFSKKRTACLLISRSANQSAIFSFSVIADTCAR